MQERATPTGAAVGLLATVATPWIVTQWLGFFFQHELFAGLLLPARRWREWRPLYASDVVLRWVVIVLIGVMAAVLIVGALRFGLRAALLGVGRANLAWVLLLGHQLVFEFGATGEPTRLLSVAAHATPLVVSLTLAWWLTSLSVWVWPTVVLTRRGADRVLVAAIGLFVVVFAGLAIAQERALHVPHGDSVMYEEHLWNLLHGKGFRSQLDDGRIFLGEHFQIVHALLVPIYMMFPQLATLQVCESLALALGAVALTRIGRRHGLTPSEALLLGIAWLLYFPMQYVNLEVSWKTFRPIAFGAPLLLFAMDALESQRRRLAIVLLLLTVTCQEDYLIVIGALGLWCLLLQKGAGTIGERLRFGGGIAVGAGVGLVAILTLMIPAFRSGHPHYTPYFASLGHTPVEIVRYVITHPTAIADRLTQPDKIAMVLLLVGPWCGLSLFSPGRLLVAVPTLGYLLLGDREGMATPFFHFHAPVLAPIAWSAVAGWGRLRSRLPTWGPRLVLFMMLTTGVWLGKSPLSWKFHDPLAGSPKIPAGDLTLFKPEGSYWRDLYVPTARARRFELLLTLIATTERVAATDYIRGRFTHHAAAHDYPTLRHHVTIDDLDVIVLDKTEGYWGRGPTNPDSELRAAMTTSAPAGAKITIRDRPFVVLFHDEYFLAVRRVTDASGK